MNDLSRTLESIAEAAANEGLPSLARRSGVPYTTLLDWQRVGWRPKAVSTLEKLAAAAALPANDTSPTSEAA